MQHLPPPIFPDLTHVCLSTKVELQPLIHPYLGKFVYFEVLLLRYFGL